MSPTDHLWFFWGELQKTPSNCCCLAGLQRSAWKHMAERLKRKHVWKPIGVWGCSVLLRFRHLQTCRSSDCRDADSRSVAIDQRVRPAACGGWPGWVRSGGWRWRPRCDVCCHRALNRSQKTETLEQIPGRMGPPEPNLHKHAAGQSQLWVQNPSKPTARQPQHIRHSINQPVEEE